MSSRLSPCTVIKMNMHWLQHVPFEGLGMIRPWAISRGMTITCTRLFAGDPLPGPDAFDWLIVMGGPMGIYDHDAHPWLAEEKQLIRASISAGKKMLGICLGAQLMADALHAKVYPGPQKEIGWFPVKRTADAPAILPEEMSVFHWHGDTFDLPDGATRLASSAACANQGFIHNNQVIGLQFHMETTLDGMEALIGNCGHELVDAPYIQSAETIRAGAENMPAMHRAMERLLDSL